MGPFMHAGHPSITWGENSPPATVPCVPCAPGSRESVSSHRYHTHILCCSPFFCLPCHCHCLVCVCVLCPFVPSCGSCCPSGPSIRQPVSRSRREEIFLALGILLWTPFAFFSPRRRAHPHSSHVAAARIAADSHHLPAPPRGFLSGALFFDATLPFAGPTRAWGIL